jgi:hypothetical protein
MGCKGQVERIANRSAAKLHAREEHSSRFELAFVRPKTELASAVQLMNRMHLALTSRQHLPRLADAHMQPHCQATHDGKNRQGRRPVQQTFA